MSEFANALADLLTKMDQKLDALAEQQKALDAKLERYSAYLVKKMNDTAETLTNVQTAQAKLVSDAMDKMGRQVDVMERQIAGRLSPEEKNDAVMNKLSETADSLHHSVERSINLISYHGRTIEQSLAAQTEQLSQAVAQLQNAVLTDPARIERAEAVPENPDGVLENPEIAVFENPDAEFITPPDVPVENPEAVILNGDDRGGTKL